MNSGPGNTFWSRGSFYLGCFFKLVTAIQTNTRLEASAPLADRVSAGKRNAKEAFQARVRMEPRRSPLFPSLSLFCLAVLPSRASSGGQEHRNILTMQDTSRGIRKGCSLLNSPGGSCLWLGVTPPFSSPLLSPANPEDQWQREISEKGEVACPTCSVITRKTVVGLKKHMDVCQKVRACRVQ